MGSYIGISFPADASYGEDFFNTKENLMYRFIGTDALDPLHWIIWDGQVATDPDTTGWGNRQRGAKWFNVSDMQWKGFNGSEIVLIG